MSEDNATDSNVERTRKRAWRSKTKTGCKTCKIRRVKCDETKPACNRCTKFGRTCDGYDADEPRQEGSVTTTAISKFRPLLKKPLSDITKQPSSQFCHNAEEFQCFRLYCEETGPRLSGATTQGQLWPRLLLQASQDQPFIRNAIFTIGALSKTLSGGGFGPSRFKTDSAGDGQLALKQYHNFALWHYDKFLKGVRNNIAEGDGDRRLAMIACILVVCIETLQNNSQSAFFHARAGIDLMHDWLANTPSLASDIREDEDVSLRNPKLLPGIASPAPHIIEDELVQQFSRLELQLLAQFDLRTPERHARLKREGNLSIKLMPTKFTNTHEAMLFIDLIRRRSYNFMAETLLSQHGTAGRLGSVLNFKGREVYAQDENVEFFVRKFKMPDEVQIEHEMFASENRRWAQAFEPLFRSLEKSGSEAEQIQAKLLKIHSLALTVRLAGHLSTSELIYDNYLPECLQILALSESVLGNQNLYVEGSFSFDMGLTYDFSTICISCRDRAIRRRALSLLNSKSWREGAWGSRPVADLATFIMEIEEEASETEYIPEQARARLTSVQVDMETRMVTLTCLQGMGENARLRTASRDWSRMF